MLSITTTSKAYASSASKTDIKKSSLEAGSDSWECHQSQVDYEQDECVAVFFYLMCFCVLFVDVCCCYCYYCAICCVQQQKESNKFRLINTQKIISFFLLFSSYKPPLKMSIHLSPIHANYSFSFHVPNYEYVNRPTMRSVHNSIGYISCLL